MSTLYIVPTPIGNLSDISERALETLRTVAFIAAEDTRHTQKLLQHYGISTPTLSLHEHNEDKRSAMLCQRIKSGESIALVSDAGTPLISDPGFVLVRRCREQNIPVVALPGPCAAITALSAAGLPTDRFIFEGFLPVKSQARENRLALLAERTATSVFYESPRRIEDTVNDLVRMLDEHRTVVVAKEISKAFETYFSGTAYEVLAWLRADPNHQRGEFVLMVAGADNVEKDVPREAEQLLIQLMPMLPLKKAASVVAEHYNIKKNALYTLGLSLNEQK